MTDSPDMLVFPLNGFKGAHPKDLLRSLFNLGRDEMRR
jgi:hypothetical protein